MNKRKWETAHAKKRFQQRENKTLNRHLRKEIIHAIQNNKAQFLCKQSNRVKLFKVMGYNVVYDSLRKNIVTFLTDEMTEKNIILYQALKHKGNVIPYIVTESPTASFSIQFLCPQCYKIIVHHTNVPIYKGCCIDRKHFFNENADNIYSFELKQRD